MTKLLNKEMRLTALPLTYLFIIFGLMAPVVSLAPGHFVRHLDVFFDEKGNPRF